MIMAVDPSEAGRNPEKIRLSKKERITVAQQLIAEFSLALGESEAVRNRIVDDFRHINPPKHTPPEGGILVEDQGHGNLFHSIVYTITDTPFYGATVTMASIITRNYVGKDMPGDYLRQAWVLLTSEMDFGERVFSNALIQNGEPGENNTLKAVNDVRERIRTIATIKPIL